MTFSDPENYARSIRGANIELTELGGGDFAGKITRVDFHRLWMQRLSENLPRILHSAHSSDRVIVSFQTQPGASLIRSGIEVSPHSVVCLGTNHSYFQRSSGPIGWGAMSMPMEDMRSVTAAVTGHDLKPLPHDLIVNPGVQPMARLQRLHLAAGRLAEVSPDIIANPAAAHGLEQALLQAMIACLGMPDRVVRDTARHRHAQIMRRFHAAIGERSGEAVYIPELCATVGVPERTLRLCCYESLGMGPKRYLLLRRMNLARQRLRRANSTVTTVTEIAASLGFWSFGRFAVEYKALFDEAPSGTLQQAAP